jgi:transcriptional accessory protein Tex/SPT6
MIQAARQLSERKLALLRAAAHHEQLVPALESAIRSARSNRVLEDLNLPFRRRKRPKESLARRERLAPLQQSTLDVSQHLNLGNRCRRSQPNALLLSASRNWKQTCSN